MLKFYFQRNFYFICHCHCRVAYTITLFSIRLANGEELNRLSMNFLSHSSCERRTSAHTNENRKSFSVRQREKKKFVWHFSLVTTLSLFRSLLLLSNTLALLPSAKTFSILSHFGVVWWFWCCKVTIEQCLTQSHIAHAFDFEWKIEKPSTNQ